MASSKFTPKLRAQLLELFEAGCTVPDAAAAAGVNITTLKGWLTRGRRDESGEYAVFAAAVDEVREEARSRPVPMDEDELVLVVSEAARRGNTQAMKLRYEMLEAARKRAEEPEEPADPLAKLDELAERRAARA